MSIYRCYFLDSHDHIRAAEDFDADALADAIDRARAMLKGRAHHHTVEVWQGARRLYPVAGEQLYITPTPPPPRRTGALLPD